MLESPSLRLASWADPTGPREISDAETGRCVGLARWLTPPGTGWRRWFASPTLEVVESEDESLLLTLRRSWRPFPMWDVRDADGRFVGSLHRSLALDPLGYRFAWLRPSANGGPALFLSPQGEELGQLFAGPDGLQLTFAEPVRENPFAKMLLLAAALVR